MKDCSVDIRKEMVRSIYLGGGITMLRGFPERLEAEIAKLVPTHLTPKVTRCLTSIKAKMNDSWNTHQVHASPYRYHASYIGACALSNSSSFDQSKITREEWSASGDKTVIKWKI